MHPTINIAIKAARKAGDIILRYHNQIELLNIKNKAKNDFVSEIDKASETEIINEIHEAFPEHSILAEETGEITKDIKYQWIIDPLDGTNNYLHKYPHYAISIAMYERDKAKHCVIYDPFKEELFYASRGMGAYLNDNRIRVSNTKEMQNALIGTGFPFRNADFLTKYLEIFAEIHPKVTDIRRSGSAALDLAYIAAGRLDGFWEFGLNKWDIAAGILLIKEAGGFISDFSGKNNLFAENGIIAGNEDCFKELLTIIKAKDIQN